MLRWGGRPEGIQHGAFRRDRLSTYFRGPGYGCRYRGFSLSGLQVQFTARRGKTSKREKGPDQGDGYYGIGRRCYRLIEWLIALKNTLNSYKLSAISYQLYAICYMRKKYSFQISSIRSITSLNS